MNNRRILLKENTTNNVKKRKNYVSFPTFMKKRVFVGLLIILALLLEIVNIFLTNRLDTDSIIASQLQTEVAVLTQENNVVRAKVYELASYESVASRAAEFGFKEAGSTLSLESPVQVARQ